MVLAFPRAVPNELKIAAMVFMPSPMIEVSPLRSGEQISSDLGPVLWRARSESALLTNAQFGEVRAWYDTLLSAEKFLAYDKWRQYPIAHKNGWGSLQVSGNAFDGTGRLVSVTTGVLLAINTLPTTGFTLSAGDYLSFPYGSSLALHRVVAGATSSSGSLTVEVRPQIRVGYSAGDVISFYRPSCHMKILPGSYSEDVQLPDFGRVSFEARQAL